MSGKNKKLRYDDLVDKLEEYIPDLNLESLHRAYVFAASKHEEQMRCSGEPFITHPLSVAYILTEMELDLTCIIGGLLHDVVEDTNVDIEEIESQFGEDVAHIVDGVTKLTKLSYKSEQKRQAETYRKMILAMIDDIRVLMVKLADRVHNIRTLDYLNENLREEKARETMDIYAPLANRLGIGRIKKELEEYAFRHLHPDEHKQIVKGIEQKRKIDRKFINRIEKKLREMLESKGLEGEVKGRVKSHYSIYKKMNRKDIALEEIYDYIAFRIITETKYDCYTLLGMIHNEWSPIPDTLSDYIGNPKPNNYQSIHTSLLSEDKQAFEVQLRTKEMDRVAERGIAAHWKYKESQNIQKEDEKIYNQLRRLLELHNELEDSGEFMHALKVDLYPDEVYALTPKGDVISLPKGASPVDFAYKIHTEVGHHCRGARVDGKLVALDTPLETGNIVEIVTADDQTPSKDWLNYTKTSTARSKIKKWIRDEENERARQIGKKVLTRELKRMGKSLEKDIYEHKNKEKIFSDLGIARSESLLSALGFGKVEVEDVLKKFFPEEFDTAQTDKAQLKQVFKKSVQEDREQIVVDGFDDLMTKLAGCCNPLPGEPIFGYITRGKGVSIHKKNCSNAKNLYHSPNRKINASWKNGDRNFYPVDLRIKVKNEKGILADISSHLAGMDINILKIKGESERGKEAQLDLTIEISGKKHLKQTFGKIKKVDGVINVYRR